MIVVLPASGCEMIAKVLRDSDDILSGDKVKLGPMEWLLTIAVLGAISWFWLDSLRAREIATAVTAQWCQRNGAQLLDQNVSLLKIRWVRSGRGLGQWQRRFGFAYAVGGVERLHGSIDMLGARMKAFDWGDGQSIIEGQTQTNE